MFKFNKKKIARAKRMRNDYRESHRNDRLTFMMDAVMYNCDEESMKAFWLQLPRNVQLEVIGIFDKRLHEIRQEVLQYLIDSRNVELFGKKGDSKE